MIRRPPRSTQSRSSAASDVYKRQGFEWVDQRSSEGHGGRGGCEETAQCDADLDGRQKAVGVARQPGEDLLPFASLLELLDLALPQRDEGDLAPREEGVEDDQDQHQADLQPDVVHETSVSNVCTHTYTPS